jgi:hypothetical protein
MTTTNRTHALINIRAAHILQLNGRPKWTGYRQAYEAAKSVRWILDNFLACCRQGEIGDGNYGKGQG